VFSTVTLADGRALEYVELGDPSGPAWLFLHGTPGSAGQALVVADAVQATGVRLVAPSRPGYAGSSGGRPGLVPVADDVVELADLLGIARFGVVGLSGGGPFALAVAAGAPDRVTAVAVHAGCAAYYEVTPAAEDDEEQRAVRLWAAGDAEGAVAAMTALAEAELGGLRGLSDDDFARAMDQGLPKTGWLDRHPRSLEAFRADFRRAVSTSVGYVCDNLSWGGSWDLDLSGVTSRVRLVYGDADTMVPIAHAEWLRARLPSSELHVVRGGHGEATFGAMADTFAAAAPR
jgi:pimeloyl-ACP methyl ester carboxylesterase